MPHDSVDPTTQGVWAGATRTPGDSASPGDDLGVYPVHLILMHTGRVLMFSGGWETHDLLYRSWSFDPATWDPADPAAGVIGRWFLPEFDDDPVANPPPPTGTDDPEIDLFCAHHVQLEDGRVICVGGDGISQHDNKSIHFYDPLAERWSRIPERMVEGRWYPTAVALPDGSVVAFSGHSAGVGLVADTELMSPPGYVPRVITGGRRQIEGADNAQRSYPGMFLVPGGRIFYVPIAFSYRNGDQATVETQLGNTMSFRVTNVTANPPIGVWEDHGVRPADMMRQEGTALLLSPAQAGRIAVIGGGRSDRDGVVVEPRDTIEILETQRAAPQWVPGGRMHHSRANVNAVLLPDGKVLIFGGTGGWKWDGGGATDRRRFIAEIWDPSLPYDPADPSAAFTETGEMHRSRSYHSGGILLPDGRVLVAGGEDRQGVTGSGLGPQPGERVGGSSQRTMEIYEPPYLHAGTRPQITSIDDTGGPNDQIHYGGQFTVRTASSDIAMIALMRPSQPTHHTDSEQRHLPLAFWPVEGGYRVRVVADRAAAPPGYYMVWIVDGEGRPCERASFVQLSGRLCRVITDRSHFSIHEVEAQAMAGVSEFDHAFFVIVEGYRPSQIGITTASPTQAQLDAWAPSATFADAATGTAVPGIETYATDLYLEVGDLEVRQRITFQLGVRFTGTGMFPMEGVGDERRPMRMTTVANGHTCTGAIELFRQPNPYMLDGPTHWLSQDLRVFQVRPGGSQSGIAFPEGATPQSYLQSFLAACDGAPDAVGHPFRMISTDQQDSRLELAPQVDGEPVYNFAVARVRYRSVGTDAEGVRMFFRAFTTAVTNMQYRPQTYPWDATTNLPTVGASATDVLTIPFFSVPRGSAAITGDTANVKDLPASGAGGKTMRYFGAWLDINDPTPVITDPADGVVKSVQSLIRGKHQCVVAEIRFGLDPIPTGATPANNENLSQRNLAVVESDNPGPEDAHTVAHTFQLETTHALPRVEATAMAMHAKRFDIAPEAAFDELMILWGGLPPDAVATLYMPALRADDVLAAAALRFESQRLEKVDEHTIRCPIGDITYVPLPAPQPRHVAGLLKVVLPKSVRTGETYKVVVRQHSRQLGRIVGTFELLIPVRDAEEILPGEARLLAVLKSIAQGIKPQSLWFPVFERYLGTTGARVRGVGGNPTLVEASPEGRVPAAALPDRPARGELDECCQEGARGLHRLTILAGIALLVLVILLLFLILRG
jgi:hypothetical protein